MGKPDLSVTFKVTVGFCPGAVFFTSMIWNNNSRQVLREPSNRVCTLDGSVKLQVSFRNVTLGTQFIVGLRSTRVLVTGGEINIVVTGAAGGGCGVEIPVVGLCARTVMTVLTILDPIEVWERNVRKIGHACL